MKKLLLILSLLIPLSLQSGDSTYVKFTGNLLKNNMNTTWHSWFYYGVSESELEFPINGSEVRMDVEVGKPGKWFSALRLLVSKDYEKGTGYDTDWIVGVLYYKTKQDVYGRKYRINIDAGYTFNNLKLYLTAQEGQIDYGMKNGVWLISEGSWYGKKNFSRLNSTWEFHYTVAGLGAIYTYPLFRSVYLIGRGEFLPYIEGEAEAWWNLRALSFHQTYKKGYGINYTAGLGFKKKFITGEISMFRNILNAYGHFDKWVENGTPENINMRVDLNHDEFGIMFSIGLDIEVTQ